MNKFEKNIPKKVSIVMPAWFIPGMNGKYRESETYWLASECLKKLIERTPKEFYELIIVDNGSTLADKDIAPDLPSLKWYWSQADILIRNQNNLGFAIACNQAINLAKGRYVICINNDILVWEGWIDALLEPFESEITFTPPVGVVMPALMKETRDAREALKMEKIDLTKNHDVFGDGAEFGSCWIAKKELIDKIKEMNKQELGESTFYDENFLLGMGEDRKVWQQVRMLGYQTYRTHNTRVFHQGNMSLGKIPDRKKYTFANREYLAKWKQKHNLV